MKGTILSGFRPTGKTHIGNLIGALENWVKLQDEYSCYFEIADWHLLTTGYETTSEIQLNIIEMAADWIAAGLDPKKSVIFIQSQIKEHAELHLLFSMITPISWLERNPTLKEQIRNLKINENINYGLLGYPVLQAADILCYKATAVPVGEDQLPHLELSREIARRFNSLYKPIFPDPKSLITQFPKVPGIDGKKMSKSMNNAIFIADNEDEILKKVKTCITDTSKVYKNDPGHPDICNVFQYHRIFNKMQTDEIRKECVSGKLGCVDCKKNASDKINEYIAPIREKRNELLKEPESIYEILNKGSISAGKVAETTLNEVNKCMNLIK
ncbi:MAG: tryptophan--tRNA ligase [bacterium (Candidatus Stahlbacteria) CG23_combo_of_CG06-09_8_20_14_all_34_7]|nr:MAG: tryptophan--tRNA ligase [bacterium (Candidatus Stahlbacteria) CG23_combo_of_CG06-09_8_20_14_all_34_7]